MLMAHVGNVLIGAVGVALLYVALLARESERKQIQGWLEMLWIKVDDLAASGLKRHVAFGRVVASTTAAGLNAVFGQRILSPRALTMSIVGSLAALTFTDWARYQYDAYDLLSSFANKCGFDYADSNAPVLDGRLEDYRWRGSLDLTWAGYLTAALVVSYLGHRSRSKILSIVFGVVAPLSVAVAYISIFRTFIFGPYATQNHSILICEPGLFATNQWHAMEPSPRSEALAVAITVGSAVGADVVCIALIRWLLRRSETMGSIWRTVLMFASTLLVGALAVGAPIAWYLTKPERDRETIPRLIAESNTLDAAICAVYAGLAISLLVHRFLWPLVSRPLEAIANERIVQNHRKVVATVGVALLGLAVPALREFVKNHL